MNIALSHPELLILVRNFVARFRAYDRFSAGRRLANLTALWVLAGSAPKASDLLLDIRNTAVHYGDAGRIEDTLYQVSLYVEDLHPALGRVFSSVLTPDILEAGGALPELASMAANFAQDFSDKLPGGLGVWFDAVLDEISHGANAGEVSTPRPIARLMGLLVGASPGDSVLDPSCGVGATLVEAASLAPSVKLYGQDSSRLATALSTLRLYLLGFEAEIILGDSLRAPARWRNGLERFDAIICDPPVGMAVSPTFDTGLDERFRHMQTQRSEALFVEHCLQHLRPSGRAVLLLQSGFLSRRGGEAYYRADLVSRGLIEGIISLPPGVIPWTELPFSLVVLRGAGRPELPLTVVEGAYLRRQGRRSTERLNNEAVNELHQLYQGSLSSRFAGTIAAATVLANGADIQPRRWLDFERTEELDLRELYQRACAAELEAAELRERLDKAMAYFKVGN